MKIFSPVWGANNERKFVFIIDMCVLVKSRKSLDNFYVVHPTSCRRSFPLSQQIFKKKAFSLLTRNNFPSDNFPFTTFPAWRPTESVALECICERGKSGNFPSLDFHENCLKMALEYGGRGQIDEAAHWISTQPKNLSNKLRLYQISWMFGTTFCLMLSALYTLHNESAFWYLVALYFLFLFASVFVSLFFLVNSCV